MTRNQIEYWRLQETKRSNLENERIKQGELEVHQGTLQLGWANLQLSRDQLNEMIRSHKANEYQARINSDRNFQLTFWNIQETIRSNKARESIQQQQIDELARNNARVAAQNDRRIVLQQQQNLIQQRQVVEQERANMASEQLRAQQLAESVRHSKQQELLQMSNLAEQSRSNRVQEGLSIVRNNIALGNLAETRRSNIARENETVRSHKANEMLELTNIASRTTTELIKAQKYGGNHNGKTKSKQSQESTSELSTLDQIWQEFQKLPLAE